MITYPPLSIYHIHIFTQTHSNSSSINISHASVAFKQQNQEYVTRTRQKTVPPIT